VLIITINNSVCTLSNMSAPLEKKLKELLSYKFDDSTAFFSGGFAKKISLLTKRGDFPSGLLELVLDYLLDHNIEFSLVDKRKKPKKRMSLPINKSIQPYPHQNVAVDLAIKAGQSTVSMPTGSGKSLVIALFAARLGAKTLVVVPTLEIKQQLIKTINSVIACSHEIVVENVANPKLKTMTDFDCLIIDEAHHASAKTYRNLNKKAWAGIYYRLFVTATPFRNSDYENILFQSVTGRLVYQMNYRTAVDCGYIVPIDSYYVEIPKKSNDLYAWQEVYKELVINNEERNKVIASLCNKLINSLKPTLCLVKEIAHGKILSDLIGAPFAHGQDEDTKQKIEDFNSGKITMLIGTEGILGEGIDTKPCEYVIIAGLGKAKSSFMQKCGRAVRRHGDKESGKIILIKDRSHKFTSRHFKAQCDILKEEYDSIPIKLEL